MRLSAVRILSLFFLSFVFLIDANGQGFERDIPLAAGGTIRIINRAGRVGVRAIQDIDGKPAASRLVATGSNFTDDDIKTSSSGNRTEVLIDAKSAATRIDLVVAVPERSGVKIETTTGSIEINGSFGSVEAKTETGTISTDIPAENVRYTLQWTESRPRFIADFELSKVKEKSGGKFEIKGHHIDEQAASSNVDEKRRPDTISLSFTTARGIILLNVPPNEVTSDLRERPLTEAAKSIIRSGDALLMEAIRRANPKHFGDYARTLPPYIREPSFAVKATQTAGPSARLKTASVRVADLRGRSIEGLRPADFEVTENGEHRDIVSVERSTAPFNLVLLLDVSGSIETYVNSIRKAARNFINTVDKHDRVAIVIFNDDVKLLSRFTTDKGKLSETLDTFEAGGGTAYYDALAYTIADTLRPLKGERSAIVILTDGEDNRSFLAFDSMAGAIQESGALIYPLYVPSGLIAAAATGMDLDPLRKKYMSLSSRSQGEGEKLARISGGVYYPITEIDQIQSAYEDIVRQLRSAYDITFRSSTVMTGSGTSPRLKIKAKRENAFVTINTVVAKEER